MISGRYRRGQKVNLNPLGTASDEREGTEGTESQTHLRIALETSSLCTKLSGLALGRVEKTRSRRIEVGTGRTDVSHTWCEAQRRRGQHRRTYLVGSKMPTGFLMVLGR